ncbi:tyrosine-protein kinase receptor ver-3 isoform X2 [Latimeria chalumnae]|uniref:tyrosine-protein kinase receptor ver-3 isoform X2 n=1 Tax=Latimeria chalumnae TaxID=7897 RepID=UPI00313DD2E5
MQLLLTVVLVGLLSIQTAKAGKPVVVLKDHNGPVLEGEDITLECMVGDEANASSYAFEVYSKWMGSWYRVDTLTRFRCWMYNANISRADGRLLLQISNVYSRYSGPYRCASMEENSTSVSDSVTFPVHFLREICLSKASFRSYFQSGISELTVAPDEDVEVDCNAYASETPQYQWQRDGDDWVEVTSRLKLQKVSMEQAGTYTCRASHPSVPNLVKYKSFMLRVEKASFTSGLSEMSLILAIVAPVIILLLVIGGIASYIHMRRSTKEKGPLVGTGYKAPIYKGSLESVPSTVGDDHPLVM